MFCFTCRSDHCYAEYKSIPSICVMHLWQRSVQQILSLKTFAIIRLFSFKLKWLWEPWEGLYTCTRIHASNAHSSADNNMPLSLDQRLKTKLWKCLLWLNHSQYVYIFSVWYVEKWSMNTKLYFFHADTRWL